MALISRPGGGAKPHQAECAGYGDAGADVAVDQHDDDLHRRRQHRQGKGVALAAVRPEGADQRDADAQHQRDRGAEEKRG